MSKTVLLTGASAGIGVEVVRALARREHRLALTARRADRLEAVAAEARLLGAPEVLVLPADLADPDVPGRLVTATVERFGGLDVVINNAGYGLPRFYARSDRDQMRSQIEVNLTAPIMLVHHALPYLKASKGMVINVGSSISAVPIPIYGVYGMTKAALAYWNDSLRRELHASGVHVCLVEPGPVATEFFDSIVAREGELGVPPARLGAGVSNLMRERPPAMFTATAEDAAFRIVRLIEHPKRRISMLRRMVWPCGWVGTLFRLVPPLGDAVLSAMIQWIEATQPPPDHATEEPNDVAAAR